MSALNGVAWASSALGHQFQDPRLLAIALSHPSAPGASYQRLEFLGDRVLGCVIADWLYHHFPAESEGQLARRSADLVRTETCAAVARGIGAHTQVRMAAGAALSGVQHLDNVLADVCEALIGALYLDGGLEAARRFIRTGWASFVDAHAAAPSHPKSALQEWAQARGLPIPGYTLVERSGPDHAPLFTVEVALKGRPPLRASGASKQEAERAAALACLATLDQPA